MFLKVFPSGPYQTNAILCACPKTKKGFILDPSPGSSENLLEEIEKQGIQVQAILLTHSHWDHIADCATLKKTLATPLYVHQLDALNVEKPGSDGLPFYISIEGTTPDHFLREGDLLQAGEITLKVIETPGHSPGGVCFFEEMAKILFSGDTLFQGSIGNLSLPTANSKKMLPSLEKLSKLPAETKVYPGHGPSTTIGEERGTFAHFSKLLSSASH